MENCSSCSGFIPAGFERCPNCAAAAPTIGFAKKLFAGGACAITLMACYGAAYPTSEFCPTGYDPDYDGYCGDFDCGEGNASIHVGASDPEGDGIDQNCDGTDGEAQSDAGIADSGS